MTPDLTIVLAATPGHYRYMLADGFVVDVQAVTDGAARRHVAEVYNKDHGNIEGSVIIRRSTEIPMTQVLEIHEVPRELAELIRGDSAPRRKRAAK